MSPAAKRKPKIEDTPAVRYERVVSVRISDELFQQMRQIAAKRRLKPAEAYRVAVQEWAWTKL